MRILSMIGLAAIALAAAAAMGDPSGLFSGAGAAARPVSGFDAVEDVALAREKLAFANPAEITDLAGRRLDHLLGEAVDRLADGKARDFRARFLDLAARRRAAIDALEAAKFDAAIGSEPGLLDRVAGLARPAGQSAAEAIEARIAAIDAEMAAAKAGLREELARVGAEISEAELDGLLVMATADSFIDMMAAYANLRAIDEILRQATESSGESLAAARRYYGLHATLAEIAQWMQARFIAEIETKFLPELDAIEAEARALKGEATSLRSQNPESQAVLDANLAAQDLTLKTAALYRRALEKQRDAVAAALAKTRRQVAVAVNTWRTVKVSSDLVAAMRSSDDAFDQLLALAVPDLRPFQGVEIRAEFERITGRLVVAAD